MNRWDYCCGPDILSTRCTVDNVWTTAAKRIGWRLDHGFLQWNKPTYLCGIYTFSISKLLPSLINPLFFTLFKQCMPRIYLQYCINGPFIWCREGGMSWFVRPPTQKWLDGFLCWGGCSNVTTSPLTLDFRPHCHGIHNLDTVRGGYRPIGVWMPSHHGRRVDMPLVTGWGHTFLSR